MKNIAPARLQGVFVPLAAVAAVLLVLVFLGDVVALDRAIVPKPPFQELALKGYPAATPLADAALIVEAVMWWLCLSFVLWMTGPLVIGRCWLELLRATRHEARLRRVVNGLVVLAIVLAVAVLVHIAVVRGTRLMPFGLLVDNLAMVSNGLVHLTSFNTALAYVVGTVVLLSVCLLLLPGVHDDQPMQQLRAMTSIMYAAAVFLLVWVSAATGMYRLSAVLLVADAREAALRLAPTVSLMGGLFLSVVLAAAYGSACAWLQHRHEASRAAGKVEEPSPGGDSPMAFLAVHWPKVLAILMPLLPGAVGSVVQALAHAA